MARRAKVREPQPGRWLPPQYGQQQQLYGQLLSALTGQAPEWMQEQQQRMAGELTRTAMPLLTQELYGRGLGGQATERERTLMDLATRASEQAYFGAREIPLQLAGMLGPLLGQQWGQAGQVGERYQARKAGARGQQQQQLWQGLTSLAMLAPMLFPGGGAAAGAAPMQPTPTGGVFGPMMPGYPLPGRWA